MKRMKFLIVVALSLLLVAGWTVIAVAEEMEGTEVFEDEVKADETAMEETTEGAESEEVKKAEAEDKAMTEEGAAAGTIEAEEVTEQVDIEDKVTEEGVSEETAENTGVKEKGAVEHEEKAEEEITEEGVAAKAAEGTEESEKVEDKVKAEEKVTEDVSGGEAKMEKAEEPKPKSLKEELEIMVIGVDGIVARLSKMQNSADKKEKKELPSDLTDLEDKIASLRSQFDIVLELNETFIDKGKVHFEAWKKELEGIKSKSLRKKGEKRHERQSETFREFQDTMAEIDTNLGSFKSSLQEITDYLKYDLRPESVSEISSDINKIKRMGQDIAALIGDARKDLKSLPVFKVID